MERVQTTGRPLVEPVETTIPDPLIQHAATFVSAAAHGRQRGPGGNGTVPQNSGATHEGVLGWVAPPRERGTAMPAELTPITAWTFQMEVPIPADVAQLMVPGEQPVTAYKTFRDSAIFTTRRLIVRDAQGLTGKKVEVYSLPYSSINMWSTENAGTLDFNAEVELWTRVGHIKINLGRQVDVRRLDNLIAYAVLGGLG